MDPALTLFDAEPMTEYIAASLFGAKIAANLLAVLSSVGLLLAAMGLYGVLAYSVAQRTREFGLRMAMGAKPQDVLGLILRESATLTLFGLLTGIVLAAVSARFVSSQIAGISVLDPLTYGGVVLLLAAVAFVASYVPARRAGKGNPMVALRYE